MSARLGNNGNLYQPIGNLAAVRIDYRGVRNSEVSARRELPLPVSKLSRLVWGEGVGRNTVFRGLYPWELGPEIQFVQVACGLRRLAV